MPKPARDWSSLPADLVRRVGGIFLATSDLDYYVSLRGVCYDWRAATVDPCGAELCFRPYGWVMLGSLDRDVAGEKDRRRLFLNVKTGRFIAADTNGLLIVNSASDSEICVLNPFTRCRPTSSAAEVNFQGRRAYPLHEKGYLMPEDNHTDFAEEFSWMELFSYRARSYHTESAAEPLNTFLVDNDGDVLLVRHRERSMGHDTVQVFRVDLESKVVYPIQSIGDDRAIFLGNRCLSVDARHLPGIEGNCIYYISGRFYEKRGICMFRLADKSHEQFFKSPSLFESSPNKIRLAPSLPLSLPEVLMDYPKYAWKVGSACPTWEYY
ncbi:unnamed protein product [Alopecurus aequalis]